MTPVTDQVFAVSNSDADASLASNPHMPTGILTVQDGAPVVSVNGKPLAADVAYANVMGLLVLSSEGARDASALEEAWESRYGTGIGAKLDLADKADASAEDVNAWMIKTLAAGRSVQAARNVQLQRDLAQLRAAHEQAQTGFQRLESFVYSIGAPKRTLAFQLEPVRRRAPLTLASGDRIEQRLPTSSVGLSDVAIWVMEAGRDLEGTMNVSLELQESGEIAAAWTVSAEDIATGWLRFSLAVSLGTDRQTPILRITWNGSRPLKLAQTMHHPDPRFCTSRNTVPQNAVLAVSGWTCVAATNLPLPAGAIPDEVVFPRRWVVPTETMRAAEKDSKEGRVGYSLEEGGLAVVPSDSSPAIARLQNAAMPGMQQIVCAVETKAESGPDIEYAIAIIPVHPELRNTFSGPDFSRGVRSEWLSLPVSHWAELHLLLEEPLDTVCDIFLLTRVAESVDETPVEIPEGFNCVFFDIRATA